MLLCINALYICIHLCTTAPHSPAFTSHVAHSPPFQIYDGITKNLAEQSPRKQKIVNYALSLSRRRNELREFGKPVPFLLDMQFKMVDRIVFKKIRDRLGGNLR